jgi:hypothetical protein
MSKGTTHRTVRIEDGLWEAAKAKAEAEDVNLSDIIRTAVADYAQAREVDIYRTSKQPVADFPSGKVAISSLEDLEAICEYAGEVVIYVGKDGKLSAAEIVDDYRE